MQSQGSPGGHPGNPSAPGTLIEIRPPRPCDACRRRKLRCVLNPENPADKHCVLCTFHQIECTYIERPPVRAGTKRKLVGAGPSEGEKAARMDPQVATVETQMQQMQQVFPRHQLTPQSPEFMRLAGGEGVNSAYGGSSAPEDNIPRSIPPLPPGEMEGNSARGLSISSIHSIDKEEDTSLGLNPRRFAELYGLTSDMEPILMRHRPYDHNGEEFRLESHSIRRVLQHDAGMEYPVTFHMAVDEKAMGHELEMGQAEAIEQCVQPHGPRLVALYFRIVHPSYPILYQRGFVERYQRGFRNIPPSLLGAVYLMALDWWSYDWELSVRTTKPDTSLLRRLVFEAVQNGYHRPKLGIVEAMLLLLQCKPEDSLNPDHTWTWGCTGQALAVGQALGLHLNAQNWSIPPWERGLRKRLGWALYMQDKWSALAYGRPSHIHDEDEWAVEDLTLGDFDDEQPEIEVSSGGGGNNGGAGEGCSTDLKQGHLEFVEMVKLSKMLSEILKKFCSLKASTCQDTAALHHLAVPIFTELSSWHASLPQELDMQRQGMGRLCSNGYLHLHYYAACITLHRRITRSTALAPLCNDTTVLITSRDSARRTAESAVRFVSTLRADHLEAFWYFTSPFAFSLVGSFLTLLLVTAPSEAERTHWRDKLNRYLWRLRISCKASEPMKYAVNRLEGAILRGLEHALNVNVQAVSSQPIGVSPPVGEDGGGLVFGDFGNEGNLDLATFDLLSGMEIDWGMPFQ
ncbi:fungal-specific transcription factor domain-containing protein [Geopyxis carbonaria]|nr:fungal-specific transcription factor domain-containing protein [Geopyxis carbonaria]